MNGPAVLAVVLAIVAGIGWLSNRREKRDRELVARQIQSGKYAPREVGQLRDYRRWE